MATFVSRPLLLEPTHDDKPAKGTGEGRGTGDETCITPPGLLEGCCGVLEVEEVPPSPRTRFDIVM